MQLFVTMKSCPETKLQLAGQSKLVQGEYLTTKDF